MKKIILKPVLAVLAILFAGLSFSCVQGTQQEKVNFEELLQKPNTVIIDVRTPAEFAAGHITQSINVPLQVLPDSVENLKRFESIILVCRSGQRSGKAKNILDKSGLKNIHNGGGWTTFRQHYLPE